MRRIPHFARLLVGLSAAALGSCAPTVAVVFDFPTQRAFDISELLRLTAVRVEPDALGTCPDVTEDVLGGRVGSPALFLEETSVCSIESGLGLPDPGSGPLAFVAEVIDDRNAIILVGCTVAEAYPGSPPIRIELYPTDGYTGSAGRLADTEVRAGGSCGGGAAP